MEPMTAIGRLLASTHRASAHWRSAAVNARAAADAAGDDAARLLPALQAPHEAVTVPIETLERAVALLARDNVHRRGS
jgi:hypothetical protein